MDTAGSCGQGDPIAELAECQNTRTMLCAQAWL